MLKSLVTQLRKSFSIPHECHMGNPPIIAVTLECLGKSCEQICLTDVNDMQAIPRGQAETPQRESCRVRYFYFLLEQQSGQQD